MAESLDNKGRWLDSGGQINLDSGTVEMSFVAKCFKSQSKTNTDKEADKEQT
jgi:hypothetical protein